jgi:vacuolar-type H+-ATPase subunit H
MEEEITAYKNEKLKKGRDEIEKEVGEILKKAGSEGEKLKKKKLESKKLYSISISMLK